MGAAHGGSALAQDLSVTEGGQPDETFQKGEGAAITAMLGLHRRLVGHREPVEFVAKRLLEIPAEAVGLDAGLAGNDLPAFEGILLGTPLYVAMGDRLRPVPRIRTALLAQFRDRSRAVTCEFDGAVTRAPPRSIRRWSRTGSSGEQVPSLSCWP